MGMALLQTWCAAPCLYVAIPILVWLYSISSLLCAAVFFHLRPLLTVLCGRVGRQSETIWRTEGGLGGLDSAWLAEMAIPSWLAAQDLQAAITAKEKPKVAECLDKVHEMITGEQSLRQVWWSILGSSLQCLHCLTLEPRSCRIMALLLPQNAWLCLVLPESAWSKGHGVLPEMSRF